MREIHLSQGYVAIVDDDDFDRLAAHRWHAKTTSRGCVYAVRNNKRGRSPRVLKMHREILGAPSGQNVDHINGNALDNRKQNLRLATYGQNNANRRVVANKHGFKGVTHIPYTQNKGRRWTRVKPWKATIVVEYRQISLGYFSSAEEAAAAYDAGARKYFGQFAATNKELGLL